MAGSALSEIAHGQALEAYSRSYEDLATNWRAVETKAQGSVAIAGVMYVERDILGGTCHESRSLLLESMGLGRLHGSTKGRALNMR